MTGWQKRKVIILPVVLFPERIQTIDNIKHQYPGVVDGVIPEQISYLKVEKKLKEILAEGKSIKDLIHILEELEEECIE